MASDTTGKNYVEDLIDRPFIKPEPGDEGIGPTLGEDVSVEHEREEDARHGAHDVLDGKDEDEDEED